MSRLYDLTDTIEMMASDDYRERFKAEYIQLALRHERLRAKIQKHNMGMLDFDFTCPIDMLRRQADVMSEYMAILEKRAVLEGIDLDI